METKKMTRSQKAQLLKEKRALVETVERHLTNLKINAPACIHIETIQYECDSEHKSMGWLYYGDRKKEKLGLRYVAYRYSKGTKSIPLKKAPAEIIIQHADKLKEIVSQISQSFLWETKNKIEMLENKFVNVFK